MDKEQEKAEEELEEEHVLSEEDFGDNRDYPGKTRGGEIERERAGIEVEEDELEEEEGRRRGRGG